MASKRPQVSGPNRRGRPPNASKAIAKPPVQTGKRGRPAKTSVAKAAPKEKGAPPKQTTKAVRSEGRVLQKSSRREKPEDDEAADELAGPSTHSYARYALAKKRIPQQLVEEKWKAPSREVKDQIAAVINHAVYEIVETRQDLDKSEAARRVLKDVVRRLVDRLEKQVLPAHGKDLTFNLDHLADRNNLLNAQVISARDSVRLQREQIEKAELALAHDKESMETLKKRVKTAKAMHQKQVKMHPLLKRPEHFENRRDRAEDINLKAFTPADSSGLDDRDPELAFLLEQLRRSLESMQGNHAAVQGIDEAMESTLAAMDGALFGLSSSQQYDAL